MSLCSSSFPWNHADTAGLADRIWLAVRSHSPEQDAVQVVNDVTWCRKVVKLCSNERKVPLILASLRLMAPIRYPFVSSDALGHLIPLLLPLLEGYKAGVQWMGYSVLDSVLRASVSNDLVPHAAMLTEVTKPFVIRCFPSAGSHTYVFRSCGGVLPHQTQRF